jgi:hypothetical protein
MANEFIRSSRRVVAWTDGTPESASAAGWAAHHAAALSRPLHVLHLPKFAALVGAAAPGAADGAGFAVRDRAAVDLVRLGRDVRRFRSRHHGLPVTVEVVEDPRAHPDRSLLRPGDELVTAPSGYASLAATTADGVSPDTDRVPVPVVVVPIGVTATAPDRRVLLLTGPRLVPAVALYAFGTAADLGTALDVVRVAPQDSAFGDDYWIDAGRSAYLAESRLQADLARLRARFPTVPGTSSTLRTRPWATLRTMARAAHLLVLGGSEAAQLRPLLEFGACPVAVVPEI